MSSSQGFENQNVLVTGGSSGIGLAAAHRFAQQGARVVLVARNEERLRAAMTTLPGTGHDVRVADATDEDAMAVLLKSLKEQFGALHVGVCCAGAHAVRPLAVSRAKNFEELYRQNVISAVNTIRPLIKSMPAEGGAIVLVSSVAGLRGSAAAAAYSAAKGALLSLTRSLAVEFAARRIRVNVVIPGVVETPMSEEFLGTLPPEQRDALVRSHPLGLGRPDDVAAAIVFLASADARWMTGAELVVDGGLSCK